MSWLSSKDTTGKNPVFSLLVRNGPQFWYFDVTPYAGCSSFSSSTNLPFSLPTNLLKHSLWTPPLHSPMEPDLGFPRNSYPPQWLERARPRHHPHSSNNRMGQRRSLLYQEHQPPIWVLVLWWEFPDYHLDFRSHQVRCSSYGFRCYGSPSPDSLWCNHYWAGCRCFDWQSGVCDSTERN